MLPVTVNGDVWRVVEVPHGDPSLIDRTGLPRLATTDPASRTISIRSDLKPPLLDMVLLHEVTHAITVSNDLLDTMHAKIPEGHWVFVEEWSADLVEKFGIEAIAIASESLGRPLCIKGLCLG